MGISGYVEMVLKRKLIVAIAVVLSTAAAAAITSVMTPIYSANVLLRVMPPVIGVVDYAEMVYAERVNNTFVRMLKSWPVIDAVASRLNISREGLEEKIKIEIIRDTELIKITVEDPNRDLAKGIAATVADLAMEQNQRPAGVRTAQDMLAERLESLQKEIANARLEMGSSEVTDPTSDRALASTRLRTLEETYAMLLREYEQARIRETARANSVSVVEPAQVSESPIKPNVKQNIALGAVLGLLAGIGLALVAESTKKTIRTSEDLEQEIGISVLGTLPSFRSKGGLPELLIGNKNVSHAAEHYRILRASLLTVANDNQFKTLLFTSAGPGEGKSTIVVNLAVTAAKAKQRVVLVDADFRRPAIHKVFDLSNNEGLSQALLRKRSVSSLLRSTEFEGLKIVTSGPLPPNPDLALDPEIVRVVLKELSQSFDLVIFDGPPALLVADTCLIAPLFDGVVVVARYDHTPPKELRRIISQLKSVNATVVGAVLNGYQPNGNAYYYNKYYQKVSADSGE